MPSSLADIFISSAIFSSLLIIFCSSSEFVFAAPIDNPLGIAFAIFWPSEGENPIALATSLTTIFAFIDPYVIICAQLLCPYLLRTYSITLSLPKSAKSISRSGIVLLSGFKNLSKSRSYLKGQISVMPKV
jgi:hypothetical protein